MNITDNPNFVKWFGNSKIRNRNGPIKVYHGTTAAFTKFDISKSRGGCVGPGFYFTSSTPDVNRNYSTTSGPDITIHIERAMDFWEEDLSEQEKDEILNNYALKYPKLKRDYSFERNAFKDYWTQHPELHNNTGVSIDHQGAVMPCYLRMENPYIMGFGSKDTPLPIDEDEMYEGDYVDPDNEDYEEPELNSTLTVIDDCIQYDLANGTIYANDDTYSGIWSMIETLYKYEGSNAKKLYDYLKLNFGNDGEDIYYMSTFKSIIQELGFDGVIMSASAFFGKKAKAGMKNVERAIHYIVYEPSQIKSALGNSGTYSQDSDELAEGYYQTMSYPLV